MTFIAVSVGIMVLLMWVVALSGRGHIVMPAPTGDPAVDLLHTRFVERSRAYRETGGVLGIGAMAVAIILRSGEDGRGGNFDLRTTLSFALVGSLVGSVWAEGCRLRAAPRGHRATLVPRRVRDDQDAVGDRRMIALAVISAAGAGVGLVESSGRAVVLGMLLLPLVAVRWWATQRIVERPRPPLPAGLAEADDRIRRIAIADAIGRPVAALGALVTSAEWVALAHGHDSLFGFLATLLATALFLAALRWWWTTRHVGAAA